MRGRGIAVSLLVCLLSCYTAAAQTPERFLSVSAGSGHLANTYLTPLRYQGWHLGAEFERLGEVKRSWRQSLLVSLDFTNAQNPAGNARMLYGNVSGQWGLLHIWPVGKRWQLALGPQTALNAGALYNRRNGNNPATALASWTVGASAYAQYDIAPRLFGRQWPSIRLRWTTTAPLTGIFFSPQYDELYYEIYLGNHSGLVHAAWPGNLWRWDNLVSADISLPHGRAIRLGFRQRLLSMKASNITTRIYSFAFVIGAKI